ncbi:uncharacterized protein [Macrobrachium rosenbergii]|uniref:uncharacterized protein n=1 Tax=Macrobrachium rosenbergii TaxID=79674 RepID=UPI0034D6E353
MLERNGKAILLALHGKNNWVWVDRIKAALLEEDTDVTTPHPPPGQSSPQPAPPSFESNSLPVPLASTGQCQALPISARISIPTSIPVPGPKLVPVLDPEPDTDPPTGDPPNLTDVVIAHCEPPTPDVSSSHVLPPAEDDPLAGLDITSFLIDQELSSEDTDTGSTPTMVVAATEEGDQPVTTEAAPDPAPDGAPGLSPESVPSSPLRNGLARP